ncbi:MAG: glycosyltransferase family 2 protein, partial [Candidatus Curtissbacteria bacterium]|nr:glycosyltransferase family 2 protein [Candidatus Curtissbacteria bacterium]
MLSKIKLSQKLWAVRQVVERGKSISSIASKLGCCRQSLYLWVQKYKKNPQHGEKSLSGKWVRGAKHPRKISWKVEKHVLDLVVKYPDLGIDGLEEKLKELGFKIAHHGIYNILLRYGLQTKELRHRFSLNHPVKTVFGAAISPASRVKIIEEYLSGGKHIAEICRIWNISRPTFYSWLKRYKEVAVLEGEEPDVISALARHYKRGYEHHRSLGENVRDLILNIVREHPEYSVHKIYATVPRVNNNPVAGNHGIFNIFRREGLSKLASRLRFAQKVTPEGVNVAPLYVPEMPMYRLRQLIAPFLTVPRLVSLFTRGQIFLVFILFSTFYVYKMLSYIVSSPQGSPVGTFFASISITFGLLFLLYSMKYYISVLMVLRLAQTAGSLPEPARETEKKRNRLESIFAKFASMTSWRSAGAKNPLLVNLNEVHLHSRPFVSIHVALYNEKRVVERLIRACESQEWFADSSQQTADSSKRLANYEVVIADDSTDETTAIAKQILSADGRILDRTHFDSEMEIYVSSPPVGSGKPTVKLIHRFSRSGFKGAALQRALENTDSRAQYISVFDADFVPYPDTIEQFMKSFQEVCGGLDQVTKSNIAAVQGYQWHVLNKSQTWVTRGVRAEYAGSYVIERSGEEIYGGLKQIAGSVYCIRADVLREFGWGKSITEDFELTLRLYEKGYKVVFTPYIQTPAEAVSTIKKLIRQRMRWAEGASFNVKIMFGRMLGSPNLTRAEKFEFAYLAPYYLQAAFFVVGTFAWFISEAVLGARLPFWTAAFGWSLVFTNMLALPLMNIIGLFLEESDERDYTGILSFIALSYIVVPFQAYAAIKGFVQSSEGPWFRTPKTGTVTDTFDRSGFGKFFGNIFSGRAAVETMSETINPPEVGFGFAFSPIKAESFKIRPRHVRYIGNLTLGLIIVITIAMSLFAPFIPVSNSYASQNQLKTVGDVKGDTEEKADGIRQTAENSGQTADPKNPSDKEDIIKNALS